jgi:hypothetical protein
VTRVVRAVVAYHVAMDHRNTAQARERDEHPVIEEHEGWTIGDDASVLLPALPETSSPEDRRRWHAAQEAMTQLDTVLRTLGMYVEHAVEVGPVPPLEDAADARGVLPRGMGLVSQIRVFAQVFADGCHDHNPGSHPAWADLGKRDRDTVTAGVRALLDAGYSIVPQEVVASYRAYCRADEGKSQA